MNDVVGANEEMLIVRHQFKQLQNAAVPCLFSNKDPQIVEKIMLKGTKLTEIGLLHLSVFKWSKLTHLELSFNLIGNKGCKYFSKTVMSSINTDNTDQNHIGDSGLSHLSKAQWKTLLKISLNYNQLQQEGIRGLCHANWTELYAFSFGYMNPPMEIEQVLPLLLWQAKQIRNIRMEYTLLKEDIIRVRTLWKKKSAKINISYF